MGLLLLTGCATTKHPTIEVHDMPLAAVKAKAIEGDGFVLLDYLVTGVAGKNFADRKPAYINLLKNLKPGVTELYMHAGLPNDELKAITGSWSTRAQEFETFTHSEEMKRLIAEQKIILIGYRPLRDLQHQERATAKGR